MILSSSSIVHPIVSIGVKLTGEFTSLKEPTDDSALLRTQFSLPTDPISLDPKGELFPKVQRKS
jgi:hypothetical protein